MEVKIGDDLTSDQIETLNTLGTGQIRAVHKLIEQLEKSEESENGIPIADLFENAFITAFINQK